MAEKQAEHVSKPEATTGVLRFPLLSVNSSIKMVLSYSIKLARNLTMHFISLKQNCKLGPYGSINLLSRITGSLFIGKGALSALFYPFIFTRQTQVLI